MSTNPPESGETRSAAPASRDGVASPPWPPLFTAHVETRRARLEAALSATDHACLVLDSGTALPYFGDDQSAPFRPTPHFAHWLPLAEPSCLLVIEPGRRPRLVRTAPSDYWYETVPLGAPFWMDCFDVEEHGSVEATWAAAAPGQGAAYIGPDVTRAATAGFAAERLNPAALVARLDWDRARKTDYEIACISTAAALAAPAHRAARAAFEAGACELDIHLAYLSAARCTDVDLPYPGIVALDGKAAYLHYDGKRREGSGRLLLIDSGAAWQGYACDITRTWVRSGVPEALTALRDGLARAQQALCEAVRPGIRYVALQAEAEQRVAALLAEVGVLRCSAEAAVRSRLVAAFLPHGVGHFLGLQVHDVGGRQASPQGGEIAPPAGTPSLRTTRLLEPGQVLTVEPGLYFIEMLLAPLRERSGSEIDWWLVDELAPYGGVRIEDDVLVTPAGHRNLVRETLPEG
jgi:Xaa-Pro dipeptidase